MNARIVEQVLLVIYEIGLTVLLILVGPFLLLQQKARAGLIQKLGFIPGHILGQLERLRQPILFHTVSVGEFNAAWPFILNFHKQYPNKALVISTTTRAGQKLARERAESIATIIYFPFDLSWIVSRWLDAVRPGLVAILETELWPCFMEACQRRKIPVVMLNGRMSPRSYKRLKLSAALFAPMLRKFAVICAQSQQEAARYQSIGGSNLPISVCGNLKYDGLSVLSPEEITELKENLNIHGDDLVLVAGSTHEGEERMVLSVLEKIAEAHANGPRLRLIIAPRHPERFERVGQIIASAGFITKRYSKGQAFESAKDVFVLDTIGVLSNYYSVASVAFVGGTIAKVGGHNLAEPYAYGVPVACGPSVFKTRDVAAILCERNALLIGSTAQDVEERLINLLSDEQIRNSIGNNGKLWLTENQGAVARALRAVDVLIPNEPNGERLEKQKSTRARVELLDRKSI